MMLQELRKMGMSFRTGKLACLIRNLFESGAANPEKIPHRCAG